MQTPRNIPCPACNGQHFAETDAPTGRFEYGQRVTILLTRECEHCPEDGLLTPAQADALNAETKETTDDLPF